MLHCYKLQYINQFPWFKDLLGKKREKKQHSQMKKIFEMTILFSTAGGIVEQRVAMSPPSFRFSD